MLRLLGIMISIGLADSVNPTTVAPALYLASVPDARRRLAEFTAGVFLVYFVGGAVIALGPGQLVLSLVPKPSHTVAAILEMVAGAALLVAAALLLRHRHRLRDRQLPSVGTSGRSSFLLGAGIMLVELPTAFPYFAAIAALVGSGFGPVRQVLLLLVFNLCFIVPLLGIIAILYAFGDRAPQELARARAFLERHWPLILGIVALLAGGFVIALGATGLTANAHGRVGRFSRRLRRLLTG